MSFKSLLSKPYANLVYSQTKKWSARPEHYQDKLFNKLIKKARNTTFGADHRFKDIKNYQDFKKNVPIRDYEGIKPYVEKILNGQSDVLWPGKPAYFAKTSGTTSGVKYIPITKDSIPNHIDSAKNALLHYIYVSGNTSFLSGNMIFLSGSPELDKKAGINTGRLSGIVNHHVPSYLQTNQLPSYETNCIEDWEQKLEKIIEETIDKPMSLISGIPPWVQMYFDRLIDIKKMPIKDIFPDFSLFVYGGVNYSPYEKKINESVGKKVDNVETYPASEGFIAYQDNVYEPGLLMQLNSGIFFEFIPVEEVHNDNPDRLSIHDVELDKNYAVIINSNAGLWGYNIGDTVKFISKYPHKLVVTGRIKHFISAFGEHVIAEEVEKAMRSTVQQFSDVEIVEFTVAPYISEKEESSYHEWFVEFTKKPSDMELFANELDSQLKSLNIYYDDLISGNILQRLKLTSLEKDAFRNYMKSRGKLGGQNKVPRLSNDRAIADELEKYAEKR